MAQTPNFDITEVAANQNQKEVTINTGFVELEAALSSYLAVAMLDADYTLTTGEGGQALGNVAFQFSGTITADRNIIVPINKKLYLVMNNTSTSLGFSLVVKTPSGTGVAIAPNNARYTWVYCDGTNVVAAGPAGGAGSGTVTNNEGALTANQVVLGTGGDDVQALGSVGTTGEVLTSNGPGVPPSWQAGGGGGGGTWAANTAKKQVVVESGSQAFASFTDAGTTLGDTISLMGTNSGWAAGQVSPKRGSAVLLSNSGASTLGGWRTTPPFTSVFPATMGLNVSFFTAGYIDRITDARFWVGLTNNIGGSTSTNFGGGDLPGAGWAAKFIGFRFSTIASDTNYQCVCSDGSGDTVVDSGVAADTASHRFAFVCDDATPNVKFYIDGNLVATITTHLPSTSTGLGTVFGVAWASSSLNSGFSQTIIQTDF